MTLSVREQRQARIVGELIKAAGGVEAAAEICGKSPSLFSAYQSPNDHRSMPLRDIEALEGVTHGQLGHPHVTRFLARQAGYSLLQRPNVPRDRREIMALLSKQAKERGETDPEILDAVADGQIDEDEAERLIPLLRKSLETTAQMLAEAEAIAGRDVPHG